MDESVHVETGSARNVTTVSPRALEIANRFDIVVKTVYALFLHSGKGEVEPQENGATEIEQSAHRRAAASDHFSASLSPLVDNYPMESHI